MRRAGGCATVQDAVAVMRQSPLSHPARLAAMTLLAARHEAEFTELQDALGLTPGNLWSHLEKLRRASLVRIRYRLAPRQRPRMVVEVTEKGLSELASYLRCLRVLEEATGLGFTGSSEEAD